ncbi:MAG TPA: hypothetical protein PKD98_04565 [Anaerolineae bacterium]|nr:hypothetical protein [Anaerolineae bacterium]
MADVEVHMDIPAVKAISKKFDNLSQILANIGKVLEFVANTLKNTAYIGLVGGAALLHIVESIRPKVDEMGQKCAEISKDVMDSVIAFERGDQEGATRFY